MFLKGKIIKIIKDEVIIATSDFDFIRIKKPKGASIGKEVSFSDSDIIENFSRVNNVENFPSVNDVEDFSKVNNIKNFSRVSNSKKSTSIFNIKNFSLILGIAALLVMVFMVGRVYFFNSNKISDGEFAYISVDINPSVEFVVDKTGSVVNSKAFNKDAERLLASNSYEFLKVNEAILKLIQESKNKSLVDQSENSVLIAGTLNMDYNKAKENEEVSNESLKEILLSIKNQLTTKSEEKVSKDNIEVKIITASPELRSEAIKNNVSIGRYTVFVEAENKGFDVSIEQVKGISVNEILKIVKIVGIEDALINEKSVDFTPTNNVIGQAICQ